MILGIFTMMAYMELTKLNRDTPTYYIPTHSWYASEGFSADVGTRIYAFDTVYIGGSVKTVVSPFLDNTGLPDSIETSVVVGIEFSLFQFGWRYTAHYTGAPSHEFINSDNMSEFYLRMEISTKKKK